MAAKGGLFALLGSPPPPLRGGGKPAPGGSMGPDVGADDEDDSGDALPPTDEGDAPPDDPGGGPFDTYAETIFDPKSDTPTKTDALRQAILTLIEERGGK